MDNNNGPVHSETDDWLLSDELWQIQLHAMLPRFIAEQVITDLWLMNIQYCIYVT